MSVYGIQLIDGAHQLTLTPDINQIISAGRVTLPSSLNGDGTYGTDISLGGTYAESQLTVIITPVTTNYSDSYTRFIDGSTLYFTTHYATSAYTYYTRNSSTGVMSVWSGGAQISGVKNTWTPILCAAPVCFWDKLNGTTFSNIRLFGATMYIAKQPHVDTNFCLAGSASGNCESGSPSSVNDNNESTAAGCYCRAFRNPLGGVYDDYYTLTVQVSFTSKTVNKIEICQDAAASGYGGSASLSWTVSILANGSWHDVITGSGFFAKTTHNSQGVWLNSTAVKIVANLHSHAEGDTAFVESQYNCYELRAWGNYYTESEEKSIIYSIGSSGVSVVDYMVALRKYD